MNSLSPGQFFSARTAPLWVVLAFIIGMTIYSQFVKFEAGSIQSTRDLAKTFPRVPYEAAYEQRSPTGLSILYVYCDGQGKVRHESTMPHSTAVSVTIYDFPKKKRYYIQERQKTYLISELSQQGLDEFDEEMFKSNSAEALGKKTINGMLCRGYRTGLNGDKNAQVESWFNDRSGCLVASTAPSRKNSTILTRYIARQPKATLFSVPPGYKQSATAF
ncbi:DUF4412 domain-containing protein [bacterium]|nr:DUF4412 domain-containing protein [bacterium]MBP9806895.1 DUF4412 domain-containing protein [bacterium]